jgi:hypothetical protein
MKNVFVLFTLFGWLGWHINGFAQTVFSNQHELFAQVIKKGEAQGTMNGEIAEHFSREFRSTGALLVQAKIIRDLKRADCKRIETTFTKQDVATPDGLTEAILKTQMNYCLDGSAPETVE